MRATLGAPDATGAFVSELCESSATNYRLCTPSSAGFSSRIIHELPRSRSKALGAHRVDAGALVCNRNRNRMENLMVTRAEAFPTRFLQSANVKAAPGGRLVDTIEAVEMEEMPARDGRPAQSKP